MQNEFIKSCIFIKNYVIQKYIVKGLDKYRYQETEYNSKL